MKITQLADYFDARTGNPLAVFVRELSERGHAVTVLTSNIAEKPGKLDDSKVKAKVERFLAIRIGTKAFFPALLPRILFAGDLGIVHAHVLGFFSLFVCALLKPLKGYRLAVTPDFDVRNPKPSFPKNILVWLLMKFPLLQADLVLPFTELEKKELHKRFGIPLEKMKVLPIGIDCSMFQGRPKRDYRKELGLQKKFVLLSACFLQPKKNLEMVLDALGSLPKYIILVHAGGFPNAEYRKKIDAIIKQKNLSERVFFLGNKTVEEMADAYKCADVFVQTGFRESYCIPIIEAMASGLPVVTTRVGVAGEAVAEGENGFFAESPADVEKAARRLFENHALRKRISESNKARALDFGWEKIIPRLEQSYQKPKRVLLVSDFAYPVVAGTERLVFHLAKYINESKGFHADIICPRWNKGLKEKQIVDGITIYSFETHPIEKQQPLRRIVDFVKAMNRLPAYDIYHGFYMLPVLLATIAEARIRGRKSIITFFARDQLENNLKNQLSRPFILGFLKCADSITAYTWLLEKRFKRLYFPNREIVTIPGWSESAFKKAAPKRQHQKIVLFVGRINESKGVFVLLKAFSLLPKSLGARLVVIGQPLEKERALAEIKRLGISDRTRLLGFVPDKELNKWYNKAGIVVVPALHPDGFGLSLMEAVSCGKPVISTASVGTPDGKAYPEIIVEPGNEKQLAEALSNFFSDKAFRKKYSESYKRMARLFEKQNVLKKYLSLYSRTLSGRN